MKSEKINKIKEEDLIIQVHHIGGIGDCGRTECLSTLGKNIHWTFYDADADSLSKTNISTNKVFSLVNRCIGKSNIKVKFNIMQNPTASSVLNIEKGTEDYVLIGNPTIRWGDCCKTVRTIDMELVNLDTLLKNKEINNIDFLSIDAQGLDLDIIEGLEDNLKSVLGLICEVEFTKLYEGQPLFCDVYKKMAENNFRLYELYNPQYFTFHPYPLDIQDHGFVTTSEPLFINEQFNNLKNIDNLTKEELTNLTIKCIKLATIALCFGRIKLAYETLILLENKDLINLEELSKEFKNTYIPYLYNFVNNIKMHLGVKQNE